MENRTKLLIVFLVVTSTITVGTAFAFGDSGTTLTNWYNKKLEQSREFITSIHASHLETAEKNLESTKVDLERNIETHLEDLAEQSARQVIDSIQAVNARYVEQINTTTTDLQNVIQSEFIDYENHLISEIDLDLELEVLNLIETLITNLE